MILRRAARARGLKYTSMKRGAARVIHLLRMEILPLRISANSSRKVIFCARKLSTTPRRVSYSFLNFIFSRVSANARPLKCSSSVCFLKRLRRALSRFDCFRSCCSCSSSSAVNSATGSELYDARGPVGLAPSCACLTYLLRPSPVEPTYMSWHQPHT